MKPLALLAVLLTAARPAPAQTGSAVVSGHVVLDRTLEPMADTRVFLNRQDSSAPPRVTIATTTASGEFTFAGVAPGTYLLGMNKLGFFPAPDVGHRTVTVAAGEALRGVDLMMSAGAALAGRIVDAAGRPQANVSVAAIQVEPGGRLVPGVDTSRTTAAGEFQVQSLPPGEYVIVANASTRSAAGTTIDSMTYFPGVLDIRKADAITVKSGEHVSGLDFKNPAARTVTISGVVVDAGNRPVVGADIELRAEWMLFGGVKATARTDAEGRFELGPVAPSVYKVAVGDTLVSITADQDLPGVVLRVQAYVTPAPPAFEVASVRPSPSGADAPIGASVRVQANRLVITGATLRDLVARAYGVRWFQIEDSEAWMAATKFDISARAAAATVPADTLDRMLQSLLTDRFGLETRRETREQPVLDLRVATPGRLGTAMRPSTADCAAAPGRDPFEAAPTSDECRPKVVFSTGTGGARVALALKGASLPRLIDQLTRFAQRTIVDHTGLAGTYDIELTFSPEGAIFVTQDGVKAAPPLDGLSLGTAMREQLGLKLESGRGPAETLIIARAHLPAPD